MVHRLALRDHLAMTLSDRAAAARLVLVERRDTVAVRDPSAARVRRYRLARTQLAGRATPRDVGARFRTGGA
jgi:hypothetical protein